MINKYQLILLTIIFQTLFSCAPKLTFTEIKERVNKEYAALNENDIDYEYNNTPVKYIKEYGEEGFRKKLQEIYKSRKDSEFPIMFNDIGELKIQDINKCNSTYFYKVKYTVDKTQMTPYLDSTALELNYKNYGKENVNFNPNSKILQTRLQEERILIFDKDKVWKILPFADFDSQLYDRLFGNGFSVCLKSKVDKTEYLPYW
ncbi:hypothetical protein KO566_14120 [Flavobacteriaceae bacterium XHP0103]|uniref:hypothetical protein n=1 Tax=Marixanthotalea marina TaxID=2844359 RepID=UPI002989C7A8|nr:hypothetical protein [Marixanthotalea marina]MBU3823191.1 hypothetical protein [Marixanthotalea marina]